MSDNATKQRMAIDFASDKTMRAMAESVATRIMKATHSEGGTTHDAIVTAWIAGFVEGVDATATRLMSKLNGGES